MINKLDSGIRVTQTNVPEPEMTPVKENLSAKTEQAAPQKAENTGSSLKAETESFASLTQSRLQDQLKDVKPNPADAKPASSVLELFRAAKSEGKAPWTDGTVNRFMKTNMTPAQYPKAFGDFKGWVKTNFFLTPTQHAELNSMSETSISKVRNGGFLAAQLNKPLSFELRHPAPAAPADPAPVEPAQIQTEDPVATGDSVTVGYSKAAPLRDQKIEQQENFLNAKFAGLGAQIDPAEVHALASTIIDGGKNAAYTSVSLLYAMSKAAMSDPPDAAHVSEIADALSADPSQSEAIASQLTSDPDFIPMSPEQLQSLTTMPPAQMSEALNQTIRDQVSDPGFQMTPGFEKSISKMEEWGPQILGSIGPTNIFPFGF